MPKHSRMGRVEQEAPGGAQTLIDFVLEADNERAALLAEAETASDPMRIAEIQTRLVDIDAHAAPARAASILNGLGFDEAAQNRALSEFSGGWRMRVALAAVLFSAPDLLLLDEPTNYLDLEGALWLVDYLKTYPATIIVISHDRDLLDDVANHILHLDTAKLTLWTGGYTSFERQRREQKVLQGKAAKKQEEKRAHLQSFVDRFRASATKATQAQSRLKMLARMEPISVIVDDNVLPFRWPAISRKLSPPIVAMEKVSVGYGDRVVLSKLDLTLSNDDRIGLLGSNGNGKSTFAKLLGGRLPPMGGKMIRANKLEVGFFAQHQVDDLELGGTPYSHVAEQMRGEPEVENPRPRRADRLFRRPRGHLDRPAVRRREGAAADGSRDLRRAAIPHPRRADQPSRHRQPRRTDRGDQRLRGRLHPGLARSPAARGLRRPALAGRRRHGAHLRRRSRRLYASGARQEAPPAPRTGKSAPPSPEKREPVKPRRDLGPLRKEIVAVEQKMHRFQDLLRRIDEALASSGPTAGATPQVVGLAAKRTELERALLQTEEEWLELSARAEAMN